MRNIAINILISVVTIIVCVIFLDIGLRYFSSIGPRSGYLKPKMVSPEKITPRTFVFEPNYSGTLISRDFEVPYKVNSLGFREREIDFIQLSSQHPYMFIGDSFFTGWGVPVKARLSELVSAKLQSKGLKTSSVNFATPGYGSYQYLDILKLYAAKIKPRLVIIGFFVGNDFLDDFKTTRFRDTPKVEDKKFLGLYVHKIKTEMRSIFRTSPIVNIVKYSLWDIKYFRYIFDKLSLENNRIVLYKTKNSLLQEEIYKSTFAAFDRIAEFSNSTNIPLLVVIIPDNLQIQKPELFSEYDFNKPQRMLTAHLNKRKIPYIDLLDYLSSLENPQSLHFREDIHWNQKGHEVAAGILSEYLQNAGQ